jgi:hypothetical protein
MEELRLGVFDGGWREQDSNSWDWSLGESGSEDFTENCIRSHIQCELIILLQED